MCHLALPAALFPLANSTVTLKIKGIPIWFLQNTNPSGWPLALLLTDLFEKGAVLASSFTECAPWEGGLNIPLSSWSTVLLRPVVALKGMENDSPSFVLFFFFLRAAAWSVSWCSPSFPKEFIESSYPANEQSGLDLFLTSHPLSSSLYLRSESSTIGGWQGRYGCGVKILSPEREGHLKQKKTPNILAPSMWRFSMLLFFKVEGSVAFSILNWRGF